MRPPPRRILLVRLSAIGDIVFASPLAAAFRRAWPEAHIAWLVQPDCAPLLRHHPDLDEIIEWPYARLRAHWRAGRRRVLWGEARALIAGLRAREFDLAVDLQGLLKSALPARLSGAPVRIGLGSREGSRLLMTRVVAPPPDEPRIGSEYLHLARTLGLPLDGFEMAIHYDAASARAAESLLADRGLGNGAVVICPFTTRPQKHWIGERWVALARRLKAETGSPVLMLGGPGDQDAAAAMATAAGDALVDLTGQTSLLTAAALIDRCRALIGVDTGLSHMGIAFRRPTLLLFGSTCPYLDTTRPDARVLYHPRDCSPCRRRPTCDGRFDCMRDIGVDEVFDALRALPGVSL
ncbi:glycosyltransferase family 9 protein [Thiohalocapsa marina]|uniref:Glycosyltransferase family 9 protein n=1 Tax=Thiohalocapsa marina TaxID=424902 RepID=A0A5M8FIA9_9GAMM|nr:glycosyltransferase family 9 protein [Thiohalocapsa marina]